MRRLGLVVVAVLIVGMMSWGTLHSSAQDDAIPTLQTQVADLQTRVAALEAASASPVPAVTVVAEAGTAISVSGTGDEAVSIGNLKSGAYTIRGRVAEPGPFSVRLVPIGPGVNISVNWTFGAPGEPWGVATVNPGSAAAFVMEVHAKGDWSISIEMVP